MSELQEYEVTMRFWMAAEENARLVAKAVGESLNAAEAIAPVHGRPRPVIKLTRILSEEKPA